MSLPRLRPGINDISPYIPGRTAPHAADRETIHKLSANESAIGPSPKAVAAFERTSRDLHLYPNGGAVALHDAIAAEFNIDPACVIAGAGSDEILCLLMRAFIGPGDSIVQTRHGFSMYHIYARSCGAEIRFAAETKYHADIDNILDMVAPTTRLVCLANPNNPTGTMLSREKLKALRDALREDILLVIDGAYAEYIEDEAYESGLGLTRTGISTGTKNVFTTRTFSKLYGLGGLRLGWGFGPEEIINALHKIRGPFNVSTPAMAAGVAALGDVDFIAQNIAHNMKYKPWLEARLAALGLTVVPGHGNFVLAQIPGLDEAARIARCKALIDYLESKNIFIRAMSGYFLPDFVRISVGPANSLKALINEIEIFNETQIPQNAAPMP